MKRWHILLILTLVMAILAGCGGDEATPAGETAGAAYSSDVLDTSYEGALDEGNQLVLGTLQLEGTEYAITPEQAAKLLPLWQALRGGVTAQAEVHVVLQQIEDTMSQEQLAAIAAMQLTQEDMRAWMQEQGPGMGGAFPGAGGDPNARATRQAELGGEGMSPPGGEMPSGEDMPPEMATLRAQFENMSEEERAAMRATMQAGGGRPGGGPAGAGGTGRFGILLNPLIELLTGRAAE